jgi:hypothetical protein
MERLIEVAGYVAGAIAGIGRGLLVFGGLMMLWTCMALMLPQAGHGWPTQARAGHLAQGTPAGKPGAITRGAPSATSQACRAGSR